MHHTIFVGGIHGVGKTEFCKVVAQHLYIDHISASDLIRKSGKLFSTAEKQIGKVTENQNLLVDALRAYKSGFKALLLDGHFCLLDKQFKIQNIPLTIFDQIAPKAAIVMTNKAEIITDRLRIRDGVSYSLDLINAFQENEIDYAKNVCQSLNIPLMIRNSDSNMSEDIAFMRGWLSK